MSYKLYATYNDLLYDITNRCNNMSWSSDKDTLAVQLDFDSIVNMEEGTQVGIENVDNNLIYMGILFKKTQKKFENAYTCMDFAFYLKNKTTIQFNNVSASDAIQQLCNKFNIELEIDSIATKINKIYKAQEASSIIDDILTQAENETGQEYIKEMNVTTLVIKKLEETKITPKIIIGSDVSLESSIENMKNSIIVQSNDENDNTIYAAYKDDNSIEKYGLLQEVQTIDSKNKSQASQIAKNFILKNNKVFKNLSFSAVALNDADEIKANRMMNIILADFNISTWLRIKSVKHTLKNNLHELSLEFDF
ncbi:hypothetical protein ACJDT4_12495 [Clostridium neuense]|uniref:YqbQ/XkdQ domain-containing protein n=1 Tax=Clostridium neuense TaxID=1728934 RepID=A0ABW8TFS5_9CLOT